MRIPKRWLSAIIGVVLLGSISPAGVAAGSEANNGIAERLAAAHFVEPLVATAPTTGAEDRALLAAVTAYERRSNADDFRPLTQFLTVHPYSGWRTALLTNLGFSYLHYGYFSRAIAAWEAAWLQGRLAIEPRARALVDRAVGELARLHGGLGHVERLSALLGEIGDRVLSGPATETVQIAREALWVMRTDPRHLYICGPLALRTLMLAQHVAPKTLGFLEWYRAGGPKGVSLAELARLAEQGELAYRPVFRKPGQKVPVPSIVHWRVGHFGAIVGEAGGRFHVIDPTFGTEGLWVTRAALDAEASGYFLAPVSDAGWRTVDLTDAGRVWGAGYTPGGPRPGGAGDPPANPPPGDCPMCGYNIKELSVGLTLSDAPVGYTPPIGPSAKVRITYNQREDSQPANFNFFNLSPKWTLNWLSYVQDDPNSAGSNVTRYLSGGGAFYYSGYNSGTGAFTPQDDDASVLVLASKNPITYQRFRNDGSIEVYAKSDGSATYPHKIFLTQVIDPQGNAVSLSYDSQLRLTALTDATGRQTTFTYGRSGSPLLITQITDPFGRSASLTYDGSGRLSSITDVLGLTSSFTYDASGLVNSMTTPYGTTQFAYGQNSANLYRWLQMTDPLGYSEREETLQPAPVAGSDSAAPQGMTTYNAYLDYRDSFHWDKHAYTAAGCTLSGGCNYNLARIRHFFHDASNSSVESSVTEALKYPLESRIWYAYPGQSAPYTNGTYDRPTAVGRVLDDRSTQLKQFAYNGFGRVTQAIDPVGRTTNFTYAANQIDLVSVTQNTAGGPATIAQFTWNSQHRPLSYTDAAGQTWTYAYNAAGQLTSVTNPLGQTTSYQYDALGYLSIIYDANGAPAAQFQRDASGRVGTYIDADGWSVNYRYDAADRVTQIAYLDGTTDQYTWSNLDLAAFQDRQGHVWSYTHDADRRLTMVSDPLGHQTQFGYWENGRLASLTDPNGNMTSWSIDVEGRPTDKHYADGTSVGYAYENTTSRLKAVSDALGQSKQYAYARDDRVAAINYVNALNPTPNVAFSWDSYFPRLAAVSDGTGTTQYSYAPSGALGALRLAQEMGPIGTIAYGYDALGRVASRSIGGTVQDTYQYDALGRLAMHADGLGQYSMVYLGETGQITQHQVVAGSAGAWTTFWSYLGDGFDRRLYTIQSSGLGPISAWHFYTTTAEDLLTATLEGCSPGPCTTGWSYGYDNANRLATATLTGASAPYAYTLDPAGNISLFQSPSAPNKAASYNNVNELTNLAGQPFSYDVNGNLLSDGARNYFWDAENRLVGITYTAQPSKQTGFTYDGLGRRTAITTTVSGNPATTFYLWCGSRLCQAVNPNGTVARSYYDEGEIETASGTGLYYGPDRLGSVRDVAAVNGSTVTPQFYNYDAYGNPIQTPAGAPLTDFRYAGMFYHADSGLYLTRYRAYDPRTARWLSRDPIGEQSDPVANLYRYVDANPVNLTDPNGSGPLGFAIGFAAGAAAASEFGPLASLEAGLALGEAMSALEDAFSGNNPSPETPDDQNPANCPPQTGQPPSPQDPIQQTGGGTDITVGGPTPSPNFIPPINPPQPPPTDVPAGHSVRVMRPTQQYPNGYWVQTNQFNQPIDPSTGKPPANVSRALFRAMTHVPLPSGE